MPSVEEGNWQPVHTYLLPEAGIPLLEVVDLQQLAAESIHEFCFIGACIRLRGATGAPATHGDAVLIDLEMPVGAHTDPRC